MTNFVIINQWYNFFAVSVYLSEKSYLAAHVIEHHQHSTTNRPSRRWRHASSGARRPYVGARKVHVDRSYTPGTSVLALLLLYTFIIIIWYFACWLLRWLWPTPPLICPHLWSQSRRHADAFLFFSVPVSERKGMKETQLQDGANRMRSLIGTPFGYLYWWRQ